MRSSLPWTEHGRADHVPRHAEHPLVGDLEVGLQLAVQVVEVGVEPAAAVLGRAAGPRHAGVEGLGPPRLGRGDAGVGVALAGHQADVAVALAPDELLGLLDAPRRVRLEELRRPLHELLTHLLIHPCLHSCRGGGPWR